MLIHKLLEIPLVYNSYQSLVGAPKAHKVFVDEYLQPVNGDCVLDIGCGTGDMYPFLPDGTNYVGIDVNPEYIEKAARRFSGNCEFICADINDEIDFETQFDIAFCFGVFHHLDDASCQNLMKKVSDHLKPEGRFVFAEPCLSPGQSFWARTVIKSDRGRFVRGKEGYESLVRPCFKNVVMGFREDLLNIPYTLIMTVCDNRM